MPGSAPPPRCRRPPLLALTSQARIGVCVSLALLMLAALCGASAPAQAMRSYPALFGSREVHAVDLAPFPKWRAVLLRYGTETAACASGLCDRGRWQRILDELRGQGRLQQLATVNREMNALPYVTDPVNWRVSD